MLINTTQLEERRSGRKTGVIAHPSDLGKDFYAFLCAARFHMPPTLPGVSPHTPFGIAEQPNREYDTCYGAAAGVTTAPHTSHHTSHTAHHKPHQTSNCSHTGRRAMGSADLAHGYQTLRLTVSPKAGAQRPHQTPPPHAAACQQSRQPAVNEPVNTRACHS